MKWEDFKVARLKTIKHIKSERYKKTEIECPNCGEYIYRDTMIILTSYPPQNSYKCMNCGWGGLSY